jgi:hypothetical protein
MISLAVLRTICFHILVIGTTGMLEIATSISHKVVNNALIIIKLAKMSNRLYLGYLDKTMNSFETMKQNQLNRFILKKKQLTCMLA